MKSRLGRSLPNRLKDALSGVAQGEWCFFLILNALRSLAWPYAGITHDAQLYSFQVMGRTTEGFFSQDLFFLHGSQDSYSIFSILLAPLAATLGITLSFFLVYLASTALLIFAEMRLVRRLLSDRLAASVALVLLAVTDLPWGGWGVFHLHEPFLTARLPAVALTLLGLEQLIERRYLNTFLLMLGAMAVHPLMAVGGLFVAVAAAAITKLPRKAVLMIACTTAASAVVLLLYKPLGVRLLGYVDPQWYDVVRRRNPYSFASAWRPADWWRIAYSLGIVGLALKYLPRDRAAVVRIVMLLGLAGVAGSLAVEAYPYALLMKGQPYRVLWLLQFLSVPLGVLVGFELWKNGSAVGRLGAIFVFCSTGRLFLPKSFAFYPATSTLALFLFLFPMFVFIFRRRRLRNRQSGTADPGWFFPSVLATLIAVAGLLSVTNVLAILLRNGGETCPLWLLSVVPWVSGHAIVALVAILLIAGLWSATKDVRRVGIVAAAGWIGLSAAALLWPNDLVYWHPFTESRDDVAFVRQFVHRHCPDCDHAPLIYWPTDPTHLWFDIPAASFYSWPQSAGVAFSRETAMESQRRARLSRRFEIANLREIYSEDVFRDYYSPFYQADIDEPGATREDLLALCREEELDFVVLGRAFRDLIAATNGTVFIYDCRSIRNLQRAVFEKLAVGG